MSSKSLLAAVFASITVAGLALPAQAAPVSAMHGTVAENVTPFLMTVADRRHENAPVLRHGQRSGHAVQVDRRSGYGHVQDNSHARTRVDAYRHAPRYGHQRRQGH